MAYEVTATRRRPQRFADLVGQEFVAATVKNAIQTNKIAHAYLFSGPRGCGKTSTARILAKALNCENQAVCDVSGAQNQKTPNASFGEPCGKCSSCIEITQGNCLDVIEIDGASNTGVNDIRQIKDEVLFPPHSGKYKIYIIDEVHMLSMSAFNALLKTIEEPPPYIIFIFATTEIHKVPATIISRCQHFNFRLLSLEQIKNLLAQAAEEQNITAEAEALFWIARESTGSIRDAYTLFDQVAAFSNAHITYEKIRDTLGLVGVERLNECYELCVDENTGAAMQFFDALLQSGITVEQFVVNSTQYMRSLLFIQAGIQKESLLEQLPERYSPKVLAAWNIQKLEHAIDLFLQAFRDMKYSIDSRFEIEVLISKLCWLNRFVSPDELQNTLTQARTILLKNGGNTSSLDGVDCGQVPDATVAVKDNFGAQEQEIPVDAFKKLKESLQSRQEKTTPVPVVNHSAADLQSSLEAKEVLAPPIKKCTNLVDLQKVSVQQISTEKSILSSALMQSSSWRIENEALTIEVATPYLYNLLNNEKSYVASVIAELWETNLRVVISQKVQDSTEDTEKKTPRQVELLCSVFKGVEVTK